MRRRALKRKKWALQDRKRAHCGEDLSLVYSELGRFNASDGYVAKTTELIHDRCHRERKAAKRYA